MPNPEISPEAKMINNGLNNAARPLVLIDNVLGYNAEHYFGADFTNLTNRPSSTLAISAVETIDLKWESGEDVENAIGAMVMFTYQRHRANYSTVAFPGCDKNNPPELTSKSKYYWNEEFDKKASNPTALAKLFIDTFVDYCTVTATSENRKRYPPLGRRWSAIGEKVLSQIEECKTVFLPR